MNHPVDHIHFSGTVQCLCFFKICDDIGADFCGKLLSQHPCSFRYIHRKYSGRIFNRQFFNFDRVFCGGDILGENCFSVVHLCSSSANVS